MARTLQVSAGHPGAYPTLRDALEAASPGTTIAIGAGEYAEAVVLDGMSVSLVASGKAGSVIIDATRLPGRSAVRARGADITLRGLVLRGGDASAVSASSGKLRLEDCDIQAGNAAAVSVSDGTDLQAIATRITGGQYGLVIEDAGGLVDKCEITGVTDDAIIVRLEDLALRLLRLAHGDLEVVKHATESAPLGSLQARRLHGRHRPSDRDGALSGMSRSQSRTPSSSVHSGECDATVRDPALIRPSGRPRRRGDPLVVAGRFPPAA